MNAPSILAALLLVATPAFTQTLKPLKPRIASVHLAEIGEDIRVRIQPLGDDGEAEFRTIHFIEHGHEQVIVSRNKLSCFDLPGMNGIHPGLPIEGMTKDPNKFFFIGHYGTGGNHTVLAFQGDSMMDPAPVLVVGFRDDGTPFKVLERDTLDPSALLPQADGTALLVGRPTTAQAYGPEPDDPKRDPSAATYDPFAVYVIAPNRSANYSLEESRRYNLKNYAWAGPQMSENLAVIQDPLHRHKSVIVRAQGDNIQHAIDAMRLH